MLPVGRETGSASSAREHRALKRNSAGAVTSLRSGRKGLCLCAPSAPSRPGRALDGPLLISGKGTESLDFFSQMVQRFPGHLCSWLCALSKDPLPLLAASLAPGRQAPGPAPPAPRCWLTVGRAFRSSPAPVWRPAEELRAAERVGRGDQVLLSRAQWAPLTFAVGCFSGWCRSLASCPLNTQSTLLVAVITRSVPYALPAVLLGGPARCQKPQMVPEPSTSPRRPGVLTIFVTRACLCLYFYHKHKVSCREFLRVVIVLKGSLPLLVPAGQVFLFGGKLGVLAIWRDEGSSVQPVRDNPHC